MKNNQTQTQTLSNNKHAIRNPDKDHAPRVDKPSIDIKEKVDSKKLNINMFLSAEYFSIFGRINVDMTLEQELAYLLCLQHLSISLEQLRDFHCKKDLRHKDLNNLISIIREDGVKINSYRRPVNYMRKIYKAYKSNIKNIIIPEAVLDIDEYWINCCKGQIDNRYINVNDNIYNFNELDKKATISQTVYNEIENLFKDDKTNLIDFKMDETIRKVKRDYQKILQKKTRYELKRKASEYLTLQSLVCLKVDVKNSLEVSNKELKSYVDALINSDVVINKDNVYTINPYKKIKWSKPKEVVEEYLATNYNKDLEIGKEILNMKRKMNAKHKYKSKGVIDLMILYFRVKDSLKPKVQDYTSMLTLDIPSTFCDVMADFINNKMYDFYQPLYDEYTGNKNKIDYVESWVVDFKEEVDEDLKDTYMISDFIGMSPFISADDMMPNPFSASEMEFIENENDYFVLGNLGDKKVVKRGRKTIIDKKWFSYVTRFLKDQIAFNHIIEISNEKRKTKIKAIKKYYNSNIINAELKSFGIMLNKCSYPLCYKSYLPMSKRNFDVKGNFVKRTTNLLYGFNLVESTTLRQINRSIGYL